MSIKSKNALVERLIPSLSGHQLLSVLDCSWNHDSFESGLLFISDSRLGFFPRKISIPSTFFPRERLHAWEYKEGMLTGTLTLHFAGLPSAEMTSIVDEELGTFCRWLDRFVNPEALRIFGAEQIYGAEHLPGGFTTGPPGPTPGVFPTYPPPGQAPPGSTWR